jgi:hypothetical protein
LVFSSFFTSGEIGFSVYRQRSLLSTTILAAGAGWFFWSEDVGLKVVDLSFFSDLVQDNTGTSPGRRATSTCGSLLAAGLFIDSQSLVGDGSLLDLNMVEAWCAFADFGECMKP